MVQGGDESNSSISRQIVAFKPRQVLLAERKDKGKLELTGPTMAKKQVKEDDEEQQQPDANIALLHSVIKYVHDKGFAKTFKRFLKEAQIEDDAWKAGSFDLGDLYCKYLDNCRGADTNFKGQKEQEQSDNGAMDKDAPVVTASKKKKKSFEESDCAKAVNSELKADEEEPIDKKKKKKGKLSSALDDNGQEDSLPEVIDGKLASSEMIGAAGNKFSAETNKPKDKLKKQKLGVVSLVDDAKGAESTVIRNRDGNADAVDISLGDTKPKLKEKKRKQKDAISQKFSDIGVENKGNSQETSENVANKESKKRKRFASDETKDKPVEGASVEESKRRKTKGTEGAEVGGKQGEDTTDLGGDGHVVGQTEKENGDVSQRKPEKSSIKQFDENTKGHFKNNGVELSSAQKSSSKQRNGSAEPKTVNAFQRVKVDAVKFADQRLQDNSYWAKDGAEIGYGAKAQEVLGQVKGRGFRHEKTKKKRGGYRGGEIDLQSHSIKFNYSDEE